MHKLMSFYWIINIAVHAVPIKRRCLDSHAFSKNGRIVNEAYGLPFAFCIFSFIDFPLVRKIERRHIIIVACALQLDTNMIERIN